MLFFLKSKFILLFTGIIFSVSHSFAQTNDDCLMCHEDPDLTMVRNGKTFSVFINKSIIGHSVHKNVACISCHKDAAVKNFPHPKKLQPVNCGNCHKKENFQYFTGVHGQAKKLGAPYAPDCKGCHGTHNILPHTNVKSRTYKMNIPALCGRCHKEGASVAKTYNIPDHNIVKNYSEGIHGKGLFKMGLIVTATCNDCHGNHLILPSTSLNSSISKRNIAKTCMKCHTRIEEVHKKVIKRKLWEKQPGAIPSCTDCHPPHKIEIQNITEVISNRICLKCHGKDGIHEIVNNDTISLKVDSKEIAGSVHKDIPCVKCHSSVTSALKRPCKTAKKVDCSNCHIGVSDKYIASIHGKAYFNNNEDSPYCTNCHGTHKIKSRYDDTSPTYRGNIPILCGKCHSNNGKAILKNKGKKKDNIYFDYSLSVHGKGLNEEGLLVSAVCTDCHTTHSILKESNPKSSVNPENIPKTCSKCHKKIYDEYITSDHAISKSTDHKKYPTCIDCHTAHKISQVDEDKFMTEVTLQCGKCHKKLAATYLETYHGKAYQLGDLKAAKCSDCHGAHHILNVKNPESSVSTKNIVNTCKKCHANANIAFTGYLTHATHNDNPVLFWAFWIMTSLLVSVFGFFGLHTLLWLPRSFIEAIKKKHYKLPVGQAKYYHRFSVSQRLTHLFVIISFLLSALTGMMLKFAHMKWADDFAKFIGGVNVAGNIHRFSAIIIFGYFFFHVFSLIRMKIRRKIKLKEFLFGSNSLIFNKQDIKDFIATIKWLLGGSSRPKYGRWTYWEKFDYMAVFWGVAVIGFSGLILWMPEFFTKFFPGLIINVAHVIHSDEALLAVGFIFTIHFFNTHLRPESFPMDTVMFTGCVPEEKYKEDRQREFADLEKSGKIKDVIIEKEISSSWVNFVKIFGFLFLGIGISLIILIIYSLITGPY